MGMLHGPHCFQKLLQHVSAGWLTWSGESGEFPRGTHVIEATEVVGIGLPGLKDFHIMQGWTDRISVWKFFMCFPMITVHFGALFPPFAALTNLLVMPCTKVFVQELGILAPLIP